jgi:hypothetical protein
MALHFARRRSDHATTKMGTDACKRLPFQPVTAVRRRADAVIEAGSKNISRHLVPNFKDQRVSVGTG